MSASDTSIYSWHIEPTELTDGSKVFDLVGASDEARVVINCDNEQAAIEIQSLLMGRTAGVTAEAKS